MLWIVVVHLLLYSASSADSVSILGLGKMGTSVAKCLAQEQKVHAWNRSPREVFDNVTLHKSPDEAIRGSDLVLIVIDDWIGASTVLKRVSEWNKQKVIIFSTYTPTDMEELSSSLRLSIDATLVGGAIVGVPETVCSEAALVLVSEPVQGIESIGKIVTIPDHDIGSASLVNIALILTITFGIAGHELALLMLSQYRASGDLVKVYTNLAHSIAPLYQQMLLPLVSTSMISSSSEKAYVPAETMCNLLERVSVFLKDSLGIRDDIFLSGYVRYLCLVGGANQGPAAWTEHAVRVEPEL